MKISYSILWFDDTEEFLDSLDLDPLKDHIKSWGFNPRIEFVSNPDDFMSYEPFHEFDLIIVDYNLEDYGHGEEFIKKIRDHDIYTEVVFYSSSEVSQLWKAVSGEKLEGVFVASRSGLLTKIEKVAKQSVRKILDLENVRGIVMAEVGTIDAQLDEIITSSFPFLEPEVQSKIVCKYAERLTEQHNDVIKHISEPKAKYSIAHLLTFCDSNKKWNLFQSIGKKHQNINTSSLGDYADEILKPRNFLAHGIPTKQDDGSLLFTYQNKEFIFDDGVSAKLRQSLQTYSEGFESILGLINNKKN